MRGALFVSALLALVLSGIAPSTFLATQAINAGQPTPETDVTDAPALIDFAQAARAAERIPIVIQRGRLLVEIAAAMAGRGDRAESQTLGRQGLDLVRRLIESPQDGGRKGYLWVQFASLQDKLGEREAARRSLDRAIEAAVTVEARNLRHDLLQYIAHGLIEIGDFEGAQKKTAILTDQGLDIMALKDIAVAQARAGDIAGARAIATKVRLTLARRRRDGNEPVTDRHDDQVGAAFTLTRAAILAEIALAEAKRGTSGAASAREAKREAMSLVDANLATWPDLAVAPLATIALAEWTLGEAEPSRKTFERALELAAEKPPFPGAELMAEVARARRKAGEAPEAAKILRQASERAKFLGKGFPQVNNLIAEVQVEVGDLAGAMETARSSRDDQGELTIRPEILRSLVRAQASASSPRAAAVEWFGLTRSPVHRGYVLLGAAEAASSAPPARQPKG
jgi:tetratricopeptide (TPR) repeat protein